MWVPAAVMLGVLVLGAVAARRTGRLRGWPLVVVLAAFGFPWQILSGVVEGRVLQQMVAAHWHTPTMTLGAFVAITAPTTLFIGALPIFAAAVYGVSLLRRGGPPAGGFGQPAVVAGGSPDTIPRALPHRADPDGDSSAHDVVA